MNSSTASVKPAVVSTGKRPKWVPRGRINTRFVDYEPRGSCKTLFTLQVPELIISGPAGTGKSRAALEKCNWLCEKYPRTRGIMIRKTRRSMTQSCVVTFEQEVLPAPDYVPFHGSDQEYRYPNGSIFALAGIDDPKKIYSSQWDFAYVNQAEELTEDEWEQIRSRLRNYRMPYQQILGDVNPDAPQHWIRTRSAAGSLTLLESRHEDNPVYWDEKNQDWTDKGRSYVLGTLESLTGVRRRRLRYGQWAAAEGAVYEDSWDRAHHVIDRFVLADLSRDQVPKEWPRYWAVDFGYKNPFVWQAWAMDPDGRLFRYKEIYKTGTIVEDHAKKILEVTKDEPKPRVIICDHDAEDRATLEKHLGMRTKGAYKAVSAGIQAVEHRLRKDPLGKARIFYLRDSVIEVDSTLRDQKLPTCTEDEFEVYCLVAGTLISTEHGLRPIETITQGDRVLTRHGFHRVLRSGLTQIAARVYTVLFSDGERLTGTRNHLVWVQERGWVPLGLLSHSDIVSTCCEMETPSLYDSTELYTHGIPRQKTVRPETTFVQMLRTKHEALRRFMLTSGNFIVDLFRRATTITTKMRTLLTIDFPIWRASQQRSTFGFTVATGEGPLSILQCSAAPEIPMLITGQSEHGSFERVREVTLKSSGSISLRLNESVQCAKQHSSVEVRRKTSYAPRRVISVCEQQELQPVYNLTVEECPEYYADGVLVHNCWDTSANRRKGEEPKKAFDHGMDTTRYIVAETDEVGKFIPRMFGMISMTKSGDSGVGSGSGSDRTLARPGGWHMDTNAPKRFGGGS
jgi:DNA polymerase III delta prime subunit